MVDDVRAATRENGVTAAPDDVLTFDLSYLWSILRRRRVLVLRTTAACFALVLAYCLLAPLIGGAYYTGVAQVLLDQQRAQVFKPDSSVTGEITFDSASVESAVAIILSERVITAVVKKLKLVDDPEFNGTGGFNPIATVKRFVSPVLEWLGLSTPPTAEERIRAIVDMITTNRLTAKRIGLSYAIEIDFNSWTANKAALIANEIAESFIHEQIIQRTEASQFAGEILQTQLQQTRRRAFEAEQQVLDFKLKNNLIDVAGTLVSDQQLAEVSSQLSVAIFDTAEKEARLKRFQTLDKGDIPDADLTDALKDEVITRLRNQYLDFSRKQADWAQRYGAKHSAVVHLRQQMEETHRSILEELQRIGQGYRSDYEIALSRQQTLQERLEAVFKQTAGMRNLQAKLRDLEATAQSYRSLHDSMLNRLNLAVQQEATFAPNARVITKAAPRQNKSWPKTGIFLTASLALGLALGSAFAFLQEYLDDAPRSTAEIERLISADYIGILPLIPPSSAKQKQGLAAHVQVPEGSDGRIIHSGNPLLSTVIDLPFSRFSETIQGLRVAIRRRNGDRPARIIGIVSTTAGEGKTTIAANLARLTAQVGDNVLLIDGDLRVSALSREFAPDAKHGLAELLDDANIQNAIIYDSISTMHFIPASAVGAKWGNPSELIGSPAMQRLLHSATQVYDYVIIDLPPLAPVVDVVAASHLIDSFIYVVQFGGPSTSFIKRVVKGSPDVTEKICAVVLNQADVEAMGHEAGHVTSYSLSGYYIN